MVLSVGVVERTSVGRIGDALFCDEDILGVLESHGCVLDVSLEAQPPSGHGIGENLLGGVVGLGTQFYGISVVSQRRCVEGLRLVVRAARIDGILAEILAGKRCSVGYDIDIRTDVARAQYQPSLSGAECGHIRHGDLSGLAAGLDGGGGDGETTGHADLDVLGQSRGLHRNGGRLACTLKPDFLGQCGTGPADGGTSFINETDGQFVRLCHGRKGAHCNEQAPQHTFLPEFSFHKSRY